MVKGLWLRVYGLRFMVYVLCFMVYGSWFMVYGLWFMVYGLGCGVWGLGLRPLAALGVELAPLLFDFRILPPYMTIVLIVYNHRHHQSTLAVYVYVVPTLAVYVYVVPGSELPIVPSYPHYPPPPTSCHHPRHHLAPLPFDFRILPKSEYIRQSRPDSGSGCWALGVGPPPPREREFFELAPLPFDFRILVSVQSV